MLQCGPGWYHYSCSADQEGFTDSFLWGFNVKYVHYKVEENSVITITKQLTILRLVDSVYCKVRLNFCLTFTSGLRRACAQDGTLIMDLP